MKKVFISDAIGTDFTDWGHRKIFLDAPTGTGKTTFILEKILPYLHKKNKIRRFRQDKKLLIVCNRRMLRKQYFYDIMTRFDSYDEVKESVEVKTYQELAYIVRERKSLVGFFREYVVICFDEVHYFYQDSDFNGLGTYPLLKAVLLAGIEKQMIFISATMDCVYPLIEKELIRCWNYQRDKYMEEHSWIPDSLGKECIEILKPVSHLRATYDYLRCICVPDQKTLCMKLAKSEGKSIVFIDDKKWADEFYSDIVETGEVKESEICRMNAENLDSEENNPVMKELALANRLLPKILITTSVLDNGISIKDPNVKNVIIFTESKVSFMQMVGRIRTDSIAGKINLYFIPRSAEYFERREISLRRCMEKIDEMKKRTFKNCFSEILSSLLNVNDEGKDIYQKTVVFYTDLIETDGLADWKEDIFHSGNFCFTINPFAERKLGDFYTAECKFHKLAREDKMKVILEQMRWLGLSEDDLEITESDYLRERQRQLVNELLTVKKFDNKQFSSFKEKMCTEYRKDLFSDIVQKNGSFSTQKLKEILVRFGCELIEEKGSNGNKLYTIQKQK